MENKQDIYEYIKNSPTTFKDFTRDVAQYMEVEWDEKFYDRIYQCIAPKGHGSATDSEAQAIQFWVHVNKNPHKYANVSYYIQKHNYAKTFRTVGDWLLGKRFYGRTQASSASKKLQRLINKL